MYFVQIRDTRSGIRGKLRALFVVTSVARGIKFKGVLIFKTVSMYDVDRD